MSYIGNTNTTQAFTPAIDYFSGNASTTAFTWSKPVASVAQIQVVVNNVAQNPSSAYTVSSNTITFTSAPSAGTNNIYVYYTSPITQLIAPSQGTVGLTQLTATGTASSSTYLRGDNSWAALTSSQWTTTGSDIYYNTGNVGIGTSSPARPLQVTNNGSASIGLTDTSTGGATLSLNPPQNSNGYGQLDISGANAFRINTNSAERMRIDSSGSVGIGTTTLGGSGFLYANTLRLKGSDTYQIYESAASTNLQIGTASGAIIFAPSLAEQARITTAGVFQFNSGYGSSAAAYGCRAWANFSGVTSVTVKGSGNVSSIAYTSLGKYTVSLTTALTDANYALSLGCCGLGNSGGGKLLVENSSGTGGTIGRTSSAFVLLSSYSFSNPGGGTDDNSYSNSFAVFR